MTELILVQTTIDSKEKADELAEKMTTAGYSACTQIEGPITSFYRWKGNIEQDQEWRCTFKTSELLYPEFEKALKQNHSYETPEIIILPIVGGSDDYLKWFRNELKKE